RRTWAYSKPSSTSPSTASSSTRQPSNASSAWPARNDAWSSESMWRTICRPGLSKSTRNIVAPRRAFGSSEVRAMTMANVAPAAPVETEPAPLAAQVRPVDAGRAGAGAQLLHALPGDAAGLAQLALVRQHLPLDERGDPRPQRLLLRRGRELDPRREC